MEERITGGCLCRAIRYASKGPPKFSIVCQCRQCQQLTGTGQAPQLAVDAAETRFEGPVKYFELRADSGHRVRSGFCGECGSPIVKSTEKLAGVLFLYAGSLDDPEQFEPQRVVWHRSAQPWDTVDPTLPTEP